MKITPELIELAIDNAINNKSKLTDEVYAIDGHSGKTGRRFLNNICELVDDPNYFEIGSWKGSTIISAAYKNKGKYTALENFSQFGGPKHELLNNRSNLSHSCYFDLIEGNCWLVDKEILPKKVNIYFFDVEHGYNDQKMAVTNFQDILSDECILLVDDCNDKSNAVQSGTFDGIKESDFEQVYYKCIGEDKDSDREGWWNGFGIFILRRKNE